ncbi:MAG TPA: SRPBCC domain-containing protein [Candidatus Sulfotelmatobacter sp.]
MAKAPLIFTYYIAAPAEKVWDGFVSKEANRTIFMGADFELDLKPGGAMTWSGPGKDGKPMRYVTGEVLRAEPPKLFEYKFGMGDGAVMSRVKVELTPETEAVKVVVTNDD